MKVLNALICAVAAVFSLPAIAQTNGDSAQSGAERDFAVISAWEGKWEVEGRDGLTIVFEKAARGSIMMERWETPRGLHSLTVYHKDGDAILAVHYCPQGNQARMEARASDTGEIHFQFLDVTDFDPGESHAQDMWFTPLEDGSVRRAEIYRSIEGPGQPSNYTMRRIQ